MNFSEKSLKIIKLISQYESINEENLVNYLYNFQCKIKQSLELFDTKEGTI